jgi:hypothetical protein
MEQEQRKRGLFWHEFLYEINRATASLMYLLQGMESVRKTELAPYNGINPEHRQFAASFPKLSYVDVPLCVSGPGFDLNDVLRREGDAEQLAYKGWVEQIYFLWESRFRNEMNEDLQGPDTIRPEGDAIGDFRLIRNDLIHKNGVASVEYSGRCEVLKWFKPGECIILGMHHVLDFLNQMGFMTKSPGFLSHGPNAGWTVFPGMEEDLASRSVPRLVSLRPSMDRVLDDGSSWHVVSVVFENGVFVDLPVCYGNDGSTVQQRIDLFNKTSIDDNGNLRFANGLVKDRERLYEEAVKALSDKGPKLEGLGVPGPAFRFRRG